MKYREEFEATKGFKREYNEGIEGLLLARQRELAEKRKALGAEILKDTETYRQEFKKMLGWPLVDVCDSEPPRAKKQFLAKEEGHSVYRMQIGLFEGLELTGLYFEADSPEPQPLVIVQHGGAGTPELISGFYGGTDNYNRMTERVLAHGVHVFAPQLLLWHEKYEVPYNRINTDLTLKRLGGSVAALELYGLSRALDYFETQAKVSAFGMVGLSYGGFYTLFMAAADTRIRSAISSCFFNTRDKYPWEDWTWFDSASRFDDPEVACLVYPRNLRIEVGSSDDLFAVESAVEAYGTLLGYCGEVGTDWLSFKTFDGGHEFCNDGDFIEKLVADLRAGA